VAAAIEVIEADCDESGLALFRRPIYWRTIEERLAALDPQWRQQWKP